MKSLFAAALVVAGLAGCSDSQAITDLEPSVSPQLSRAADAAPMEEFEITVKNLTSGVQHFTPPLITIHRRAEDLFTVGKAASFELKEIAENGNLAPMLDLLGGSKHVSSLAVATTGEGPDAPLAPQESVTLSLSAEPGSEFISFVSMLICTNDGFTGVDGAKLPNKVGDEIQLFLPAYDAGTEINTQDFEDLVPPCQLFSGAMTEDMGTGVSNPYLAEHGVVHHHDGIVPTGDLDPATYGWTEPVAEFTVRRTG